MGSESLPRFDPVGGVRRRGAEQDVAGVGLTIGAIFGSFSIMR